MRPPERPRRSRPPTSPTPGRSPTAPRRSRIPRPLRRLAGPADRRGLAPAQHHGRVERAGDGATRRRAAGRPRPDRDGRAAAPPAHVAAPGRHRLAFGVSAGVLLATVSGLFRLGEDLVDSTMQGSGPCRRSASSRSSSSGSGSASSRRSCWWPSAPCLVYINTYAAIRGRRQAGRGRHDVRPGSLGAGAAGRPARRGARLPRRPALRPHGAWLIMIVAEQINARAASASSSTRPAAGTAPTSS